MDIAGKFAVVTGAAAGLGRASAVALASSGAAGVLIADVDQAGGEETAALVRALGAQASFIESDVREPAAVKAAFDAAIDRFGALHIVHNNAGLVSGNPRWPATPIDVIQRVVQVNVLGVMFGTRLAVDALGPAGGAVVNTASIAGLAPMADDPIYAATKAAIISFTQSCAELAKTHAIRVNAILPGIIDTSMLAKTGDGTEPAAWLQPVLGMIVKLDPATVAQAVMGLISDESKAGHPEIVMNELVQVSQA